MFEDENAFREARRTWRAFGVLSHADDLGVLDALNGRPVSASEVADRLGLSPRVTQAFLNHLAACGLLTQTGGLFALGARAGMVIAALREMRHEIVQMPQYHHVLRTGLPLHATVSGVSCDDVSDRERFLAGLHRRSGVSEGEVVRLVTECGLAQKAPAEGLRVLDLGGGHGRFAAAIAAAVSGARVTLFDQPEVLEIARRLSGEGFEVRGGDYLRDAIGGPYGIVLLSNVITCEPDDRALTLLTRVGEALEEGGALIIRDRMLHDHAPGPLYAADFALALAAGTSHGVVRSMSEVAALTRAAGLRDVRVHERVEEEYAYAVAWR